MELKNYAVPLGAALVAIALMYGVFLLGANAKEKTPEELLLAALEKPAKYADYTYEYTDDFDNYKIKTRLVQGGGFSIVKIDSPVFEKSVFSNSTSDVLCISFARNMKCSEVLQNSTMKPSAAAMKNALIGKRAEKDVAAMKIYVKNGAVKFGEGGEKRTLGGKECDVVKYVLDYSKLTIEDLGELGMSPNDPAILYSRNYSFEYCIDNESNIVSVKLDYFFLGVEKSTETKILEANWGGANESEFSFPAPVNESETEALFLDAINAEKNVLACAKNESAKDTCIRNYAVNNFIPDLCLLAGSLKDKCLIITAPAKLYEDLCPKMDNASLKDDCWIEIAARKNSSALCPNVAESAKRDYCLSLTGSGSAECNSDAECFKAGCSGQLCVPESGKGTITTCEWKEEYGCLALTGCGCVNGKCAWKENENYSACLLNLKTR